MDSDNDNEGFQISNETYHYVKKHTPIFDAPSSQYRKKERQLKPPISTYISIQNYPTPSALNSQYSTNFSNDITGSGGEAWICEKEEELGRQFGKKEYRELYRKFPQERTNYKFFKQYGCDEYKTFTAQEPIYDIKKKTIQVWKRGIFSQTTNQSLMFNSNFECGNLERVYEKQGDPFQYYLILSNDTNTNGFNQWFYFKAFNPNEVEVKATFIIVNNNKSTIPYINKIGISVFSLDKYKFHRIGWNKSYQGICFNTKNNIRRPNFTFNHTFQFQFKMMPYDTVYFALTLPYSFSKLRTITQKQGFSILATTFSGNPIYVYRTGNPKSQKSIVITARQHPSETSSSFVVEGLLQKLERQSPLIEFLKKKYFIIVIPMINPDGVIHGNSRTNLLGFDINRKWQAIPDKTHSYEVFQIYHELFSKVPEIEYLIDFHGHSKKLNSFAYFSLKKTIASIMALQMADKLPWFKIRDCQIAQQIPTNTLRWMGVTHLNVDKVITVQTSIHGWSDEEKNIHPFTPQRMGLIGSTFIQVLARLEIQKKSNRKQVKMIEFNKNSECSDSDPEGDYMKQVKGQKKMFAEKKKSQKKISSPRKMRIKTMSNTFYRPTLNSSIRERLKTEFNLEKVEIQASCIPTQLKMKKKNTAVKYCRLKGKEKSESQRPNKRKLTGLLNDNNPSLSFKVITFSELSRMRK